MKRYLSIILGILLVFGLAGSAFAMHADIPSDSTAVISSGATSITLSGEIRERWFFLANPGFLSGQPELSFFDSRVRLGIDAKLSPNTEGFIQLESYNPSNVPNADVSYWGSGVSAAYSPSNSRGFFGAGDTENGVGIQNAWILHHGTGLLGVEAGLKIGLQPMGLGYPGSRLFFDHTLYGNDGVIAYVFPVKELELAAVFNRVLTGSLNLSDNANAYVILGSYTPEKNSNVTLDITFVDIQNLSPILAGTPGIQVLPVAGSLQTGYAGPAGTTPAGLHFWNIGLRGKTVVSGFSLMADGEIQTGNGFGGFPTFLTTSNISMEGWATKESIGYTVDPVTLSVDFAYGSGDSGSDVTKYKTFATAQSAEQHFTLIYEYMTPNAANIQYGGLQNTWYVKVGGAADLTKDLNLDVDLYYLQAANAINGSTNIYGFSNIAAGQTSSKDIGTELDAKITYKLDKNLKWWLEGGYLWAGDFWKVTQAAGSKAGVTDPYGTMTGIQLNF